MRRQLHILVVLGGLLLFAGILVLALSFAGMDKQRHHYRAYRDGETVRIVPVAAVQHADLLRRAQKALLASRQWVSDPRMPAASYVYTPGSEYNDFFARDFLFFLEGAGRYFVSAAEVRTAVDFLTLAQPTRNTRIGPLTYPRGAIPDHLALDGTPGWGYGNVPAPRPSMDEAFCFITLGWHAGFKSEWDDTWQRWFRAKADRFRWAWNSVPRNPRTGLVTQWTTPGHIGANGIHEYNGACVMWGFHDSYGFPGDDLGCSVLACNAAHALADMFKHVGDQTAEEYWHFRADAMRDAIRAQFRREGAVGYLPWGVGDGAPAMASPDITAYAVWSDILTEAQANAASDWFAACYHRDRHLTTGDLFAMVPGHHGAVRMARKRDDCSPGIHVWPATDSRHWENLTYGYNAYQDGGYWYYMSLPIAATLWRKNPLIAVEWVQNIYADVFSHRFEIPCERLDGRRPVATAYLASVSALVGMSFPGHFHLSSISLPRQQLLHRHLTAD